MHARRWLAVFVVVALAGPLFAQPARPNPLEPVFKASRLDPPDTNVSQKFSSLSRGNETLEPPSDAQKLVLETMARQTVYPVTHFDQYSSPESDKAELTPRIEEKSVNKLIADLRGQLVIVSPNDLTMPPTKVQFCKEYGAAVVKAVEDVLAKATLPIVRANAVRMLAVLAESGAPAALDKITALLNQKAPQVEVLYWSLKGAEGAVRQYDPGRGWVDRDSYHALVKRVDEIVREVPAVVAEQTFQPNGGNPALVTDPKAPKPPLTPEQVLTVQAFRLQAVRALGQVKTDVVPDKKGGNPVRTLYTLAQVAASDPAVVPAPSYKEVGEAVLGLANAVPGTEVDVNVLAAVAARGVRTFANDKIAGTSALPDDTKSPAAHWRLSGTRLKAAFDGWEKNLKDKCKLPKVEKDVISDMISRAVTGVIDPLKNTDDRGQSPGLKSDDLDKYFAGKRAALKADQPLFKDAPATKLTVGK